MILWAGDKMKIALQNDIITNISPQCLYISDHRSFHLMFIHSVSSRKLLYILKIEACTCTYSSLPIWSLQLPRNVCFSHPTKYFNKHFNLQNQASLCDTMRQVFA